MAEEGPVRRTINWIDGVAATGGGVVLGIYAWANRPYEMRDIQSTISTVLQGKNFLSEGAFYTCMFFAVVLVLYGLGRLSKKAK